MLLGLLPLGEGASRLPISLAIRRASPPPIRRHPRDSDLEDPLQLNPPHHHHRPSPEESSLVARRSLDQGPPRTALPGGCRRSSLPSHFASVGSGALFQGAAVPLQGTGEGEGGSATWRRRQQQQPCLFARLSLGCSHNTCAGAPPPPPPPPPGGPRRSRGNPSREPSRVGGREGSAASALLVASRRRRRRVGDGKQPCSRAFVSLAPALRSDRCVGKRVARPPFLCFAVPAAPAAAAARAPFLRSAAGSERIYWMKSFLLGWLPWGSGKRRDFS